MAANKTTFDPYHKWLGIPPEGQPADHYRLLGIQLFEKDPEVIAAATDRQMAHVQTYAIGREGELAQNLLDELAKAKICLLNPHKKRAYDLQLKKTISSVQQRSMGTPRAVPPPESTNAAPPLHQAPNAQVYRDNYSSSIRRSRQRTPSQRNQRIYFLIALLLFLLVSLVVWQRQAFIREMHAKRLHSQPHHIPRQGPSDRQSNESEQRNNKSEPSPNDQIPDPLSRQPRLTPNQKDFGGQFDESEQRNNKSEPSPNDQVPNPLSRQPGHIPNQKNFDRHSKRIDLTKKHMTVPLKGYFPTHEKAPRIKILGICQTANRSNIDIVPPVGIVAKYSKLELQFQKHPQASLLILLKITDKGPFLRIYPKLKNSSTGVQVPYTISRIKSLHYDARGDHKQLSTRLNQTKWIKKDFESRINAPGLKYETKQATQDRIAKLRKQIQEIEQSIPPAKMYADKLLSYKEFANQLHQSAEIQFTVVPANNSP